MAWSAMAAGSVRGTDDEPRLLRDYERYKGIAKRVASSASPATPVYRLELSSRGAL